MKGNYHQSFSKVLYVLGLGRSPREGNSTHFSILTRKIPWTEELEGLQSVGLKRDTIEQLTTAYILLH